MERFTEVYKLPKIIQFQDALDGEFSVPKNALRGEVYNRAAAGGIGQTSNPSTGFSDAREAVQYLSQHRSFSPQFTSSGPDRMGFELKKRYALEADLGKTRYGNKYFD